MTGETVNTLLTQLTQGAPDLERLQAALATTFRQTDETPYWTFYAFDLPGGPFARGEFRLSQDKRQALLSLWPGEASALAEDGLNLNPWGQVRNIDVNPRIPPEGTDAYIYDVGGVRVAFQLTHLSRRLRSLALEWDAT